MDATTSSIHDSSVQNMTCNSAVKSGESVLAVVYSLLFLVGISLNSFTLWFHCHGARGRASKSWMIYLKHLTAADFLLCATLPLRIIYYTSSSFNIHLLYCSVGAPLLFLNIAASILFMGYIAANRYMKIFYSTGTHFLMTPKASHIISITTWVVLLTMAIAPYCILMLINEHHDEHRMCAHLIIGPVKTLHTVIHAVACIFFLLVLFSLVFFYYSISRRVHQVHLASSNSKKLVRSRRNMLVLVSVFCFCFVPCHIIRLPYMKLQGHCSVVLYYLKEVTVLLSASNICLDPLIYVFHCKEFRAQLNLNQIFCMKQKRNTSSVEASDSEDQLNTVNTMSELQGQRQQ